MNDYHYPPVTREDWRAHWKFCRRLMLMAACVAPVGYFVGRILGYAL